ncbi:hypothetical protein PR048_005430 [Dryococelus australis]|uniref:Uncharacterized protein n=1 Tax=Dryococelus australis TaxID=614101 RepID=A0ABQ9I865_9NEOP|nr:hypothetical protein PR048_005430 [Dryococelus australis]
MDQRRNVRAGKREFPEKTRRPATPSEAARKAQTLGPRDFLLRHNFCVWFLQQTALEPEFPEFRLLTDEFSFICHCVYNSHTENLYVTIATFQEERFPVNIWAGIVHDHLEGPYLLPARHVYTVFH